MFWPVWGLARGMKLFLLTLLTMVAFAGNSVLTRLALVGGEIDPLSFGTLRLISGALVLVVLVLWQGKGFGFAGVRGILGVVALLLYIYGFSEAYLVLDAGMGALILFGVVQITMFAGAVFGAEDIPAQRFAGAALAFGGLVWLLWPIGEAGAGAAGAIWPIVMMAAAGIGWGIYSLVGRRAEDATRETALNFLLAAPIGALMWALLPMEGATSSVTLAGLGLAVVSGAITSGLGYALWYGILPALGASRAAVAQLSVPMIAMGGGWALLGEVPGERFFWAALLVMSGVLLSIIPRSGRKD